MKDDNKTKKQLVDELTELRSQNAALKESIPGTISAELAAEEAHRYAESIVETIREPLLVLDADLKIISANRNFYRTFKVTPDETLGSFIYDLGNKQWDIPKLRELLEEVLPEKEAFDDFEVDHNFESIGHKIMLLNARRIYRKDIGAKMILLAIEDITERKQLESLLIDSEERYRHLFETASDGIVFLEQREGKITHANPASEKMLGYTKKELIGNKLQDIGILLDMGDFQTTRQNLDRNGIINYNDIPVKTKSGQQMDTDIYLVDRATLVQCSIRDVAERKRIETALRTSEERFRRVFQASPAPIYISTISDGRYIDVNDSGLQLLGYTREEMIGHTVQELGIWHNFSERKPILQNLIAQASIRNESVLLRTKNGEVKETLLSCETIRFDDEEVMLSLVHDITERKQAEEALKESEKKYRLLADNVDDVIFVLDMNLNYTYISPSVKSLRGYEPAEVLKQTTTETLTPSSMDLAMSTLSEVMELEKSGHGEINKSQILQLEMNRKDGTTVWTEMKISFVRDENQWPVGIIGVTRDITERKQAEEKLQQTLESLRKAVGATIQTMVSAVEMRDPYTAGHQLRTANLACAIATEIGLPQEKIDGIRMAGSIHDIGKLSVPAEILSKPTKLTNIEFSLIKEHAQKGYEMLNDVESPWPLAQIVYQHHERMDGSGYPRNLKGEEICMEARILAVADVVEAMASHRPYRPALGIDAALEEIEKNRGTLYDNTVVDACLKLFREKGFKLEGT